MSFHWADFLTFAQRLQEDPSNPGPDKAALRSATSRAYYAAFRTALNVAQEEGFQPSHTGSDHWDIRRHFQKHNPDKLRRKISTELGRLYDNRRKADYEDNLRPSADMLAELTIGMAKSVLKNLDSLQED
jgi:uncharacterized protein (UPF0332 family)